MKILIAVETCHKFDYDMTPIDQCMVLYREGMDFHTPRQMTLRETWWKDIPTERDGNTIVKKMFYGRQPKGYGPNSSGTLDDEVTLDVDDRYCFLPYKTRALVRWALAEGVDKLFKCDDDTFVYVDRLLAAIPRADFVGRYNGGNFAAGGPGYWLSRRAMEAVAVAPIRQDEWAEDIWVGKVLDRSGVPVTFDPRYVDFRRGVVTDSTLAVCECDRFKMYGLHNELHVG